MKALSAFYDYLLPELPGCTTGMLDLHLLLVAREYCERSKAWRETFDNVVTVGAQDTYDLTPPESRAELVAVHKLTVNTVVLYDDGWHEQRSPTSNTRDGIADAPKYDRNDPPFSITNDLTQIVLIADEIPAAAGTLASVASMKPSRTADKLPDVLYNQHVEAVRAGVLARLMAMAGKPWSAPAQSVLYRTEYDRLTQFAATNAQRGNTRALLRVRPS